MKSRIVAGIAGASLGYLATKNWCNRSDMSSWDRPSYNGSSVSLTGGLTAAASLGIGTLATVPQGSSYSALIAGTSGAVAGWIDDHLEDKFPAKGKGFRGHLGALRQGKITSGLLKIVTIGSGALVAATFKNFAQVEEAYNGKPQSSSTLTRLAHTGVDSLIVAGSANLINLLDLRPGRALKVASFCVLPWALHDNGARNLSYVVMSTSALNLPTDLEGETMLGDLGANALGGVVGTVFSTTKSLPVKSLALASIIALTAASEKVSFSKVIERNKVLSFIDNLGRK